MALSLPKEGGRRGLLLAWVNLAAEVLRLNAAREELMPFNWHSFPTVTETPLFSSGNSSRAKFLPVSLGVCLRPSATPTTWGFAQGETVPELQGVFLRDVVVCRGKGEPALF